MKIIIIGASTPGLFAASLLAGAGADVEVYERSGRMDFAPRTLIFTGKISEVLGFVPEETILNEVKYVELFSKSRSRRVELARPDLIIERQKLLVMLARMAEKAGAKIFLGRRFLTFTPSINGVKVLFRDSLAGAEREAGGGAFLCAGAVIDG